MTTRLRKALLLAAVLLLLLPLTLITTLMLIVSYPAYPIPNPGVLQIVFDGAMLFMVAAIVAGWRLSVGFLRRGHDGVRQGHVLWMLLLGIGALIGIIGAGFAIEHAINPRTAADHVGFALLSPAVVLLPVCLLMWRYRKR